MSPPKSLRPVVALVALAGALGACAAEPPPAAQPPAAPAPAPAPAPAAALQAFAPRPPRYAFADPDRAKKIAAGFAAIDALAEETVKAQNLPGLALGVVVDGRLAYDKGFGVIDLDGPKRPDADTVYRIGSVTKSFTALGVLALRDDGKLSLDDPLAKLVPEAGQLVYPTHDARPLTLRQLLTHTSGLPRLGTFNYTRADVGPTEQEIVASLKGYALENTPGTTFVYSNLGFGLLGIAAGRAAGTSYRAFLTARLLKPLGMTSSGFDRADVPADRIATAYKRGAGGKREKATHWMLGASEGAGGLYSTVRDMGRYLAFQLDAYPPREAPDGGPLRRASVREAHFEALGRNLSVRPRDAAKGEPTVDARARGYAFAWGVGSSCELPRVLSHDGAVDGFASAVTFVPDAGVGVVVLTNVVDAELNALAEKVLLAIKKTGGLAPRKAVVEPDPAFAKAMERFVRVYERWDEAAYKEMLSPNRPPITPKSEQDELAGYRAVHGACKGWHAIEYATPFRGKFAMECEKGTLDMHVGLDPKDGKIAGFGGISRGLPVPAALAPVARAVGALIVKWDDRLYKKHLAPRATKPRDDAVAFYDKLRAAHGACKPTTAERDGHGDHTILLACERGGDLHLDMKLDDKAPDVIAEYSITLAEPPGTCPLK